MTAPHGRKEILWRGEFPKSLAQFILEHADEGIWLLDKNSRISAVNPKGAEIVGFTPDEMIGHSPVEFLSFTGAPVSGGKAVEKNGAHTMHKVRCKDGSASIVVSRTVPLIEPDGTYTGAIIYIINVSEANRWVQADQRAEEHLEQVRAERELLIDIITQMPEEVVLFDRSGCCLFVNTEAARAAGKNPEDLIGKRAPFAGAGEKISGEIETSVLNAFESGAIVRGEVLYASGEENKIKSYTITPVAGTDGNISVALMISRDSAEYIPAQEDPWRRLGHGGDEGSPVTRLRKSLDEVYSSLSSLQKQYREIPEPGTGPVVRESVTEVQRMHSLLDDLIIYAGAGSGEMTCEEVKTADILAGVERDLAHIIRETGTTLVSGSLPVLWVDPVHLRRIFSNLVRNAISSRAHERLVIRIASKRTGSSWQFSVKDNGSGINPEYADRVFELPEDTAIRDEGAENGVRLAVCKKIVERYGGRIWVDSIKGQGSTFYFTLPTERYAPAHQSVDIARP